MQTENSRTPVVPGRAGWSSLAVAFLALALPSAGRAGEVTPPAVPPGLEVPAGNKAFLVGHAVGTQNYFCTTTAAGGFAWKLFTPQATLFDDSGKEVITHFFSPNPIEDGAIRATWQHARDTSTFWGKLFADPSTDPAFVAPGAVAWVVLARAGVQNGPTGGGTLAVATFVQRVNTDGGVAPATGCAAPENVGATAFVPYTADYVFYRAANVDGS
jgi:uncharacterized protein DUF3455